MRFTITFKFGPIEVARVEGKPLSLFTPPLSEIAEKVIETERYLEQLTGFRVHIHAVEEEAVTTTV